jgi:hypothetical protein
VFRLISSLLVAARMRPKKDAQKMPISGSADAVPDLGVYCGRGPRRLEVRPHSTSGILALRAHARAPAHGGREVLGVLPMPPPPNPKLVAEGAYDLKDREIAAQVDAMKLAIAVRREGGLLIAEPE